MNRITVGRAEQKAEQKLYRRAADGFRTLTAIAHLQANALRISCTLNQTRQLH